MNKIEQLKCVEIWLANKARSLHHRQILVIDCEPPRAAQVIELVVSAYKNVLAVSTDEANLDNIVKLEQVRFISPKDYRKWLGNECSCLIFDASSGIDLNALYAFAGMVEFGGLVVLFQPSASFNSSLPNAIPLSFGHSVSEHNFVTFFKRQLEQRYTSAVTATITDTHLYLPSTKLSLDDCKRFEQDKTEHLELKQFNFSVAQQKIASEIANSITAHRNSSKVYFIGGERGRGKSTTLALVAAKLVGQSEACSVVNNVHVTSAHKQQTNAIFNAFSIIVDERAEHVGSAMLDSQLVYQAADQLLYAPEGTSVLIIDEVASLAPELVKALVARYRHVVMCGTLSGYEGSGQGFIQRTLPFIAAKADVTHFSLQTPFRWLANDPIEYFFNTLFSHNLCNQPLLSQSSSIEEIKLEVSKADFNLVDKADVVNNTQLYKEIFGLLALAHYQTSPNDIVRTLDDSSSKIVVCTLNHRVIGVAVILIEGGDDFSPIAFDVSRARRRVQGHLALQALASSIIEPSICDARIWRVNRIAIANEFRNLGLGGRLLTVCEQLAQSDNADMLASSFGMQNNVYRFWERYQYTLLKVGQRIDTASGTASIIVAKLTSKKLTEQFRLLRQKAIIDIAYFSYFDTKLATIYAELLRSNYTELSRAIEIVNQCSLRSEVRELIKRAYQAYKDKEVNYSHVNTLLFSMLLIRESENLQSSLDIIKQLHVGGIHKQQRQALEQQLLEHLNI